LGRAVTRVVLLSGGMDSAVVLKLAARDESTISVVVDYGQKNRAELVCAEDLVLRSTRRGHLVKCRLPCDSGVIFGAVDKGRTLAEIGAPGDSPKAYTPGRNTVLLALALHVAEHEKAGEIWVGANRDDYEGYPDCRREYFDAFETMCAAMGKAIVIKTPLIHFSKKQVVALGRDLGVDFNKTSSCYFGTECGACDACVLRKHALEI
jgi:7-cyano-7-deazaguanine synthase